MSNSGYVVVDFLVSRLVFVVNLTVIDTLAGLSSITHKNHIIACFVMVVTKNTKTIAEPA